MPKQARHQRLEDQPLFQDLRRALRSDTPLDLLAVVSGLVEVTDPRSRDPLHGEAPTVALGSLVDSLLGTPHRETTAALAALQVLAPDELLARRIDREMASRGHALPAWLSGLDRAQREPGVWQLTHVLGDGDDYLMGVILPSGQPLSALVYIDHNLGTVVKDAFVVPETLENLVIQLGNLIDGPDQSLHRADAATARAVVEKAIDDGARMYPPFVSDSWPVSRPLVEWMLRKLPAGGVAPEPKEWSEKEIGAIADDFLSSDVGAPFNSAQGQSLLDSVLWFGTQYATGDPFRWSMVTVELLLMDWFPRKVIADPVLLSELPDLLRAYIRWCHDREGISQVLTGQTLGAVDQYEPEYQRMILSGMQQGTFGSPGMFEGFIDQGDDLDVAVMMLERLEDTVGGRSALQDRDDAPLPDEPFAWEGVPDEIRPVVQQILDACDQCAHDLLDVEHRTAMRRFLSRAAMADPGIFRRKASPMRRAAAVAWVICRANETVGAHHGRMAVQDLLAWFGMKGGVSQGAEPLLRANGVDPRSLYGSMYLGVPDLLIGGRRAEIMRRRDYWLTP